MTPKTVKERELLLKCCADEGKTAQEYYEILTEQKYNFFDDVLEKFYTLTGFRIGSPTHHTIAASWSWSCPEEEQQYKDKLYKILEELNKK